MVTRLQTFIFYLKHHIIHFIAAKVFNARFPARVHEGFSSNCTAEGVNPRAVLDF